MWEAETEGRASPKSVSLPYALKEPSGHADVVRIQSNKQTGLITQAHRAERKENAVCSVSRGEGIAH